MIYFFYWKINRNIQLLPMTMLCIHVTETSLLKREGGVDQIWMGDVGGVGQKKRHGFKGVAILSYSLENTASSIKYDLIVPIQFNKLYSFPLSHLVYFVLLLSKWNWPVWDTCFRFIFKFVLSCLFLKLWLSLLLNVQNNEKNYEGAESEDT